MRDRLIAKRLKPHLELTAVDGDVLGQTPIDVTRPTMFAIKAIAIASNAPDRLARMSSLLSRSQSVLDRDRLTTQSLLQVGLHQLAQVEVGRRIGWLVPD